MGMTDSASFSQITETILSISLLRKAVMLHQDFNSPLMILGSVGAVPSLPKTEGRKGITAVMKD